MEQTEQTRSLRQTEPKKDRPQREPHRAEARKEQSRTAWQAALRSGFDFRRLDAAAVLDLAEQAGNQTMLELLSKRTAPPAQMVCSLEDTEPTAPVCPIQTWPPVLTAAPDLRDWMPDSGPAFAPALLGQQAAPTDWLEYNGTI